MSRQNIYDNQVFFDGYQQLRNKNGNANDLIEKPAINSLLPNVDGMEILDLGCGIGESCISLISKGSKSVLGIDISEKMLEVARLKNSDSKIQYLRSSMEELSTVNRKFDLVISSLAFHYVENFDKLVKDIFNLLNRGGILVYSQEHPLNTCFSTGNRWTKNEDNIKMYANISNYSIDGKRDSKWFVENVTKYHRSFSSILNSLIENGFEVVKMVEPLPSKEVVKEYPDFADLIHKPDFLIVKAIKRETV